MRPLIICLHAAESNIEVIDRALQNMPFRIHHEVDTDLLTLIRTEQPLTLQKEYVYQKIRTLLQNEPAFIFVTCTNYIVLLDEVQLKTYVPILKIDEMLFEQMLPIQTPIKMLFSNKHTIQGTMKRLRKFTTKELDIEIVHIPDVFDWYIAGDKLGHDQKVLEKFLELGTYETTLVVAQLSMANIAEIYHKLSGNPVVSPLSALKDYMKKLL